MKSKQLDLLLENIQLSKKHIKKPLKYQENKEHKG
jgi:hypothetical protein